MSAVLQRTTFSTSRLLEFCSRKELTAQTGHEPEHWPLVILKELCDNALDACEDAGIAPTIRVTVARGMIRVRDNGPGIPPETVASILDFSTRTSSREAYVAPDRGAQGNALKTILAMPFALSGEEGRVEIVARGIRHLIAFRVDPIRQAPVIDHQTEPAPVRNGTAVTVHWPASSGSELALVRPWFLQIAETYSFLNPHLGLTVIWRDADHDLRRTWQATRADWPKWTPAAPTCPHWYDGGELERLIGAYIAHDAAASSQRGHTRTVSEFVAGFAGLTGTAKRKAVVDAADLSRAPLTRLLGGDAFDDVLVWRLLFAMREEARPVKPERLGIIGREHVGARLAAMGGDPDSFQYRLAKGTTTQGRPWLLEVAFAHRPGALRRPVLIFVHLAMPRPLYTDRGKSSIALSHEVREALGDAIETVTKAWVKQRVAEIRDHHKQQRRREALARLHTRAMSIKDAVWQVLPDAYDKASSDGRYPALARQIYYAARPKILELTEKDTLDANYFSYQLLPLFMQEHDLTRRWRVHFKPRGNLTEPHTGIKIPLGTADVAEYRSGWTNGVATATKYILDPWSPKTCGPHSRFGDVLAIEKEGFADLLIEVGIGRKYDVGIIGNEGQSVEAELALADALELPLFILHDFDRTGLTIAENLRSGTWRHRYVNRFPVVDVGLRLHQVDGLEDEPISRDNLKSVSDDRLRECGAIEDELAFLRHRRVELNALTTEQLIALVETAFAEHGVRKVIPSSDELVAAWRSAQAYREIKAAVDQANKRTRRWRNARAPDDLVDQVRGILAQHPGMSWEAALRRIVDAKP
jgi:DNA topoisomerase VI subunit B